MLQNSCFLNLYLAFLLKFRVAFILPIYLLFQGKTLFGFFTTKNDILYLQCNLILCMSTLKQYSLNEPQLGQIFAKQLQTTTVFRNFSARKYFSGKTVCNKRRRRDRYNCIIIQLQLYHFNLIRHYQISNYYSAQGLFGFSLNIN